MEKAKVTTVKKEEVVEVIKLENVESTEKIEQSIIEEITKFIEGAHIARQSVEDIKTELQKKNQESGWKLSDDQLGTVTSNILKDKDVLAKIGQKTQQNDSCQKFLDGLTELTSGFFCNELREPYVIIRHGEIQKYMPIKGSDFEDLIKSLFWKEFKKSMSGSMIKDIKESFSAIAKFGENSIGVIELSNRLASDNNKIVYSLGNAAWKAVVVTDEGWQIEKEPALFKKYAHQKPQHDPIPGGDANDIFKFLPVTDENTKLLLLTYLILCFVPNISKPLLVLHGPQGSGKSTISNILKRLVDPSMVALNDFPASKNELIQVLHQSYMTVFDNLSQITNSQSDTLCRAVTGGSFQKRKLYTDSDSIIFKFKRCVVINGIDCIAKRADLLDRSILVGVPRLAADRCVPERVIVEKFNSMLPSILGGIFDVLSKAMKILPTVQLDSHPRMADFAKCGYAVAEALGVGGPKFIEAYYENIEGHNRQVVEDNQVTTSLIQFMKTIPEIKWSGLMSELLDSLNKTNEKLGICVSQKEWPKNASHLSREMNKVKVNLEGVGIKFETQRVTNGTNISIGYVAVSLPSLSSEEPVKLEEPLVSVQNEVVEDVVVNDVGTDGNVPQKVLVA